MKLFLVTGEEGGENYDLFVIAHDRDQAVEIWKKWDFVAGAFDDDPPPPGNVFVLPVVIPDTVSRDGPRPLEWADIMA